MRTLGFATHNGKSMLILSQRAVFLGFMLDTVTMTVNMTAEKASKERSAINSLFDQDQPKIRDVA